MKPTLILLCFTGLLCMGFYCSKGTKDKYQFVSKLNIVPEQSSFHIGDTIWIEYSNPSHTLYDKKSGRYINIDSTKEIFEISLAPTSRLGSDTISYARFLNTNSDGNITVDSNITINSGIVNFSYGCISNQMIKLGYVLNSPGIFSLDIGDDNYIFSCPDKVLPFPQSYIEHQFNVNNTNENLYYQVNPDADKDIRSIISYNASHKRVFFFEVK